MQEVKSNFQIAGPNIVDRMVGFFDPVAGLKRSRARANMSVVESYVGASRSKRSLKQWIPFLRDADKDTLPDLDLLRVRSRDLTRNAPIALGAIHTKVSNVVGSGLKLQSRVDGRYLGLTDDQTADLQRTIEREFKVWAETQECDSERTLNFYGLQELAFRSCLESGDVFALLPMLDRGSTPYKSRIQLIEADRVSNPHSQASKADFAGGVEKDEYGAPIAYYVMTSHPGGDFKSRQWKRIEAFGKKSKRRNMLHLYRKLRPHQSRGVPDLAPVIDTLKQMDRYTEAELMAAVVNGMFAVFLKTEGDGEIDPIEPTSESGGKSTDKDLKLVSGMIGQLGENESLETVDPNRPNPAFDPFIMAILRQVGVALELPFEVLIKHFTSSYSASRAALLDAWRFFKNRRTWLAQNFCDPIFEAFLTEAIALGRINAPGFLSGDPSIRMAYCRCEWIGPVPGNLDPLKEAKAEREWMDIGVKSLSRVTAETTGEDWETVHDQRVKEVSLRRESGLENLNQPAPGNNDLPEEPAEK